MSNQTTGWQALRTFSAQSAAAESAPTSASAWVDAHSHGGGFFAKAKIAWGAVSTANSPSSVLFQVWYKQGSVILAGPRITFTISQGTIAETDLGVVGGVSIYITSLGITGGSSPTFTGKAYVTKYNSDEA